MDHIFWLHGVPKKIIHDRCPQFQSKFAVSFYKLLGIENNPSTAYHPQTDGQTERTNQELEQYLRLYVNHHQDDWADWFSVAEFAHNNRAHSATGFSPFYINMGYHPNCGTNVSTQATNESSADFVRRMERVWEDASAKLERAKAIMKAQYDKHRRTPMEYQPGDMVWLSAAHIPSNRPSKKLDHKFLGP